MENGFRVVSFGGSGRLIDVVPDNWCAEGSEGLEVKWPPRGTSASKMSELAENSTPPGVKWTTKTVMMKGSHENGLNQRS